MADDMKSYFDKLNQALVRYQEKYARSPRKAALKMAWLSLKTACQKPATPAQAISLNYSDKFLRIAFEDDGGLGDALIQLTYIKEIRKLFDKPVLIDFYTRSYKAFQGVPFLDHCFDLDLQRRTLNNYDVYIFTPRLYYFLKMDEKKTAAYCTKFYQFCQDMAALTDGIFKTPQRCLINQYGLLYGKNRLEQADVHDVLGVNRNTPTYLSWQETETDCLQQFGLKDTPYITLSRAVDEWHRHTHPKLWPLAYYNQLVQLLKTAYPHIKLVQIGSAATPAAIEGVDINLIGKTSLEQVKVILKHARLHIDTEGGLVHLRRQLQGKSVVLFGPTSPEIFGYADNINLRAEVCPPCDWITSKWTDKCLRNFEVPLCMQKLPPQQVFEAVKKELDALSEIKAYRAQTEIQSVLQADEPQKIAVIGRTEPEFFAQALPRHQVTVYANDLSLPDAQCSKNCFYCQEAARRGFTAEYAAPYNIPAVNDYFDMVYLPQLDKLLYPAYAVKEALRILKKGGQLILLSDKEITIELADLKIQVNQHPVCLTK